MNEEQHRKLSDLGVLPSEVVRLSDDGNVVVQVGGMRLEIDQDGEVASVKIRGDQRDSLKALLNGARQ